MPQAAPLRGYPLLRPAIPFLNYAPPFPSAHPFQADSLAIFFTIDTIFQQHIRRPCKIVANKGTLQVDAVISAERETKVTLAVAISGNTFPPLIVFARVHFQRHICQRALT